MTKTIRLELEHDEIKAILAALAGEAMEARDAGRENRRKFLISVREKVSATLSEHERQCDLDE